MARFNLALALAVGSLIIASEAETAIALQLCPLAGIPAADCQL